MSNSTQKRTFVTRCTDAKILTMTSAQNKAEVFAFINGHRINTDNSYKTKNSKERRKLKWLKKTVQPALNQTFKTSCI